MVFGKFDLVATGSMVLEIFMFESIYARMDGRTHNGTDTGSILYYKLTFELTAQLS